MHLSRSTKSGLLILLPALLLSLALVYFTVNNYLSAQPVAAHNLRGLALSLAETVEGLVVKDPSYSLLHSLKNPDIAFFSVIDADGIQRFHTNQELVGTRTGDPFLTWKGNESRGFRERSVTLGTGEKVYEFVAPLHLPDRRLMVRLALRTLRADAIVRRARAGMTVIFTLLAAGWAMGLLLYRYGVRAEQHRREMAAREELARLGTMGAVLAHEVRNPLAGIKGYAQLLEERLQEPESREFIGCIISESVRLEELVNDLLAYVRTEPAELNHLDVGEVLSCSVALVEPSATAAGILIDRRIGDELWAVANRDRLEQVLLNLLQNGIQAMPDGGRLTVTAKRDGALIEATIEDTGTGISPSDLPSIFEPFFTTKARGSGLGLAISRKHMEEMHGSITVDSSSQAGCTFRITLSAADTKEITP